MYIPCKGICTSLVGVNVHPFSGSAPLTLFSKGANQLRKEQMHIYYMLKSQLSCMSPCRKNLQSCMYNPPTLRRLEYFTYFKPPPLPPPVATPFPREVPVGPGRTRPEPVATSRKPCLIHFCSFGLPERPPKNAFFSTSPYFDIF